MKHLSIKTIYLFLNSVGCTEYKINIDTPKDSDIIYDVYIIEKDISLRLKASEPSESMIQLAFIFL